MNITLISWTGLMGAMGLYVVGAVAIIHVVFIPGIGAFLGYGLVVPLLAIIILCTYASKMRLRLQHWVRFGIAGTLGFFALGFGMMFAIVSIWASI